MPETVQEPPILSVPKKSKAYLDKGFPTGAVLLSLLAVVFLAQGLSAWKIMNLEHEKAALDADKRQYTNLKLELPKLESRKTELQKDVLSLQGEVANLSAQQQMLQDKVKMATSVSEDLQVKNEIVQSRLEDSNKRYEERKKEMEEVTAQHKRLSDESSSLDSKIKTFRLEIGTLESQLDNLRKEEKQRETNVVRLETREEELNKLRSSLSDIIVGLKTETVNFQKVNQDGKELFSSAIQSFDTAKQSVTTSLAKWDEQISSLRSAGAEAETHMRESESSFQTSLGNLSKTSAEAAQLMNRFEAEISELQKKQLTLNTLQQTLESVLSKLQRSEEQYLALSKSIPTDIKQLKGDLSSALEQLQDLKKSQKILEKQVGDALKGKS